MALHLQQREILRRFGPGAKCRVSYQNKKTHVDTTVKNVDWKRCLSLTVLFAEPKFYIVDGDEAIRDGVRIVPYRDTKTRKEVK